MLARRFAHAALASVASVASLFLSVTVATSCQASQPEKKETLRAIIQSRSNYSFGEQVILNFALKNESQTAIKVNLCDTSLFCNQKKMDDSILFHINPEVNISPNKTHDYTLGMIDDFADPGTYELEWTGPGFKSNKIRFNVNSDWPVTIEQQARICTGDWIAKQPHGDAYILKIAKGNSPAELKAMSHYVTRSGKITKSAVSIIKLSEARKYATVQETSAKHGRARLSSWHSKLCWRGDTNSEDESSFPYNPIEFSLKPAAASQTKEQRRSP